ncbi:MAG: dihydropteroate synthase [Candidatus Endonucleobacter bathymodioli]|uniref:dihydropteroate synthase n=1 Tax=Candidatus Endonucleibacter bathymodioli TaxID=539814 RepID=A0AA90SWZ2_9GAMM|nr:dihydropteroate synthase [Candidatus Endonucleobacter bathymodioli]
MNDHFKLSCAGITLDLGKIRIMGVLNITSDSFYGSSRCSTIEKAIKKAEEMVEAGVDILDVGGESTSKMVRSYGYGSDKADCLGAQSVIQEKEKTASCEQELEKVVPIIEALVKRFECVVSVDTSSAAVIRESVKAGVGMINDVRALQRPGALEAVAATELPVILMHSLIDYPESNFVPSYNNIMVEVMGYLHKSVKRCVDAGIKKDRIIIDPGFGGGLFGKTPAHDLSMLKHFSRFHELKLPILAGMSRKSFIGAILDKGPDHRLAGSLAVAVIAAQAGAHILRVHDVAETYDIVRMLAAVNGAD